VLAPSAAARVRLYCFPHAGGSAAVFAPWSRALADRPIEVAAARMPGREGAVDDPPPADLASLVDRFAVAIARRTSSPYALFGHSLGALVAFEAARALRTRRADAPLHLFVSGAFAPQHAKPGAPLRFIEGDAAFLEAVAAKYGGVPKIVLEQADMRAAVVPALRADLALTETYVYRPGPPLDCPITAYAGASDPIVPSDGLAAWRDQTTAGFECRLFEGHHFYLNRARDALLADIAERLLR